MMPSVTASSHQQQITTDLDVITLRQQVRQLARDLGLSLSRQAKIATAVSTVARGLITANSHTTIQLYHDTAAARPALVVTCLFPPHHPLADLARLEQVLHFGDARALVDDSTLSSDDHGVLLSLRMWLNR